MAEVYKAYHPDLDRYVAIKVLHSFLAEEEDFLVRFQREARIVAAFRHPNIVQVYDFDFDAQSNAYYMVMEFVDGSNLKAHLKELTQEGRTLPLEEAVRIVVDVAKALEYAHQRGMVHRDVKPANIMFTQDGSVILSDFGIARMVSTATLTASGGMVGTPAYMAPEQGLGQTGDERADIYSLGVVLYQLITGTLPFDADTPLGIVLQHINTPLKPPTALNTLLPAGVEAVVVKALAKDPDNRYQTASEFIDELERAMAGEPVEQISPDAAAAWPAAEGMIASSALDHMGSWEWPTMRGSLAGLPDQESPWAWLKRRWAVGLIAVVALILVGGAALLAIGMSRPLLASLFSGDVTPTGQADPFPDLTATFDVNATQFAAWMATYQATTGVTPTPSSTPTSTPTTTPTPDLTATAWAACVFDMEVVTDRGVWPSVLVPGQRFVKRWRVENTGTCAWPEDVRLVFVSGDELEVVEEPEIDSLAPEESAGIELGLRAPARYSRYASVWQLQYGEGSPIGEELEISCRVGPTPTPQPTSTPIVTATATPAFTPTPKEPLHFSVPIVVDWHHTSDGKWRAQVGLTAWGGDGNYRYYLNGISDETEFFNGTFEIEWGTCSDWWGTVIVTSGDEIARWEGRIEYPDPDRCP
jgi:serine/threonine-protein kinase